MSPKTRPIRSVIEYYEGQFPNKVKVHAFERNQLVNGDVVNDFLTRYIPDAVSLLENKKTKRSNESLSWPLLLSLRNIRLQVQPEGKKPSMQTRMLLARVAKENQKHFRQSSDHIKPQLKIQVSNYLYQISGDFLWLREAYGVTFSDMDYEHIKSTIVIDGQDLNIQTLDSILDTSNIDPIEVDISWYKKKVSYHLSYFTFIGLLRLKRIGNLYFRNLFLLRHRIKSIFY